MSNTDTGRIKLGKKVYVEETEIIDDTENKSEDSDLPVSMISRKIVADKNNMAIYVHVNFEHKKKKEAYRKINKILGEN